MIKLENDTLLDLKNHSCELYKDKLLSTDMNGYDLTYEMLKDKIDELHSVFKKLDIKKGDKVALYSENMPNWGLIYLAVTSIGAIIVPILPDFHANEVHHIVKHSESKAIFVSKKLESKLFENDFNSSLEYIFSSNTLEILEDRSTKLSNFVSESSKKLNELKNKALSKTESKVSIKPTDIAVIIYTSGTTGQSKGVILNHLNLVSQVYQAQDLIEITKDDRFLSILPLAHTLECSIGFLVPFFNGSSISYISKVPTPKILLAAMAKVKPTFMLSVPLVIEKIYKSKVQAKFTSNFFIKALYENIPYVRKKLNKIAGAKLIESFGGEIRFFGIGGAKLSPFVEQFLKEAEFPYAIGYGLTETAPLLAGAVPGKTKVGSTGPNVSGVEFKLEKYGEDGKDGELHVRGPNIMVGYFKDQERTDEILDKDGWLNTGDLGHIDEDGYLFINGRSKSVIIGSSGENIYPEALESIINQHPMVLDSLAYEEDSKVVAKIHIDYEKFDEIHNLNKKSDSELRKEIVILLEEIKDLANTKLSNFAKITKAYEQSEPFIKTPTKKIKRFLYT